jgi:two-component system, NtrC family, response regulator AtoC
VRELKNAMDYAAATMPSDCVELCDLPDRIRRALDPEEAKPLADAALATLPDGDAASHGGTRPPPAPDRQNHSISLPEELRRIERERIKQALDATGGVQIRAAELLGMPIRTFINKLRQYDLHPKAVRTRP